ncbi:MAG: glutaredoxin family protein [Pseudomonadota bacterium]
MNTNPKPRAALVLAALLTLAAGGVQAQQVFRIVGPDGKVTFSDRPPETTGKAPAVSATGRQTGAAAAPQQTLPYALQAVVQRYPVTLYTAPDCGPCGSARALLQGRGVPFAERTVTSSSDADALKRISGDSSVPFGTIGGQFLRGYSDAEWTQFLDAAGYPRQSVLPPNYRPAPATPLVAVQQAAPAAAPEAPAPAARPAAPARAPANPAGIQF